MRPQMWIVAGPNGSGKTTLSRRYFVGRIPVVNPDEIARGLASGYAFDARQSLAAGREAIAQREAHVLAMRSFAIETTLTGKGELQFIDRAREAGFKVNLVYTGLNSAFLSMLRVTQRVTAGEHAIPLVDIVRRYPRSIENLTLAAKRVDRLLVLDNSSNRRRLILSRDHDRVRYLAAEIPAWAERALEFRTRSQSM